MPIKMFFCYAHENGPLLKKLKSHLRPLQREGLLDIWHDRDISAGMEWEKAIDENLNTAQIILLLVSPDFMNSDYCYSIEMKRALERHIAGEASVIPIILRPVDWKHSPLGKLQALPTDGKPVTSWHNQDEAFFNVAEGIRKVVESFLAEMKDPYYVYIHATRGKPVLTDSMSSQSASDWLVGNWDDSSFFFSQGAFRVCQEICVNSLRSCHSRYILAAAAKICRFGGIPQRMVLCVPLSSPTSSHHDHLKAAPLRSEG